MEKLMVYSQPSGSVAEAYRAMCINMLAVLGERKIIEVAGVNEDINASLVTANLAITFAQAGKKVLLIDGNLRKPHLHDFFNLQNTKINNSFDANDFGDFVQQTAQVNLEILTWNKDIATPLEVLLSSSLQQTFEVMRSKYDIVLINAPYVGEVSDAVALGTKTDGVVLVFVNKKDKVKRALKAKEMLLQAGVNVLGCVLDKV